MMFLCNLLSTFKVIDDYMGVDLRVQFRHSSMCQWNWSPYEGNAEIILILFTCFHPIASFHQHLVCKLFIVSFVYGKFVHLYLKCYLRSYTFLSLIKWLDTVCYFRLSLVMGSYKNDIAKKSFSHHDCVDFQEEFQ